MSFELIILGSSSALPTSKRSTAAHLLNINERFFLVDCGEGTQISMRRHRLSFARINHIFISHLHGDHVFGLFGLTSSLGLAGRRSPLHLYGPSRLQEMMEMHFGFFGPLPFEIAYHVAEAGKVLYEDSKITVEPVRLLHRTETFGYVFREKERLLNIDKSKIGQYGLGIADMKKIKEGADHITQDGKTIPNSALTLPRYRSRSYAYISDTAYLEELGEKLEGVDLLFHESTFLEADKELAKETFHSTAREAAMVAKQAGAGKLLLGHFSTRYRSVGAFTSEAREIFGESYALNDGDRFSLPMEREGTQ